MKSLTTFINEQTDESTVDIKQVADDLLRLFHDELKKPTDNQMTNYIEKDRSQYTGRDNFYDILFKTNDLGSYRRKFTKFANDFVAKYGGSTRKLPKYKGDLWTWDAESCLYGPKAIFSIYLGRRLGNTKYPNDISNSTYISTNNKELWDAIVNRL